MMKHDITHHLTDALIMAYATGNLPEAFSLAVATHVSMCDSCRAAVESFEVVGGAVLESAEDAPLSATSLADTLALIKADVPRRQKPVERTPDVPQPLADYIAGSLDNVKWRPIGMGVKQAILDTSKEATARLLFIPAGTAVPDHGHNGTELTLVLRGAFYDETDRFGPGDIEVSTEADQHTPIAEVGADCICLAVTDAPLRFKGFVPRLAQRFLRI